MSAPIRWVAPTPLSLKELVELTRRVGADVEAGRHEIEYDPVQRWHTRLPGGDYADVWLISWTKDQAAELHDHAGSLGALTVLRGTLTEHRWVPGARGARLVGRKLSPGSGVGFPVGYVHDVVNNDPEPALSVHAYSPPLSAMSYYEIDGNEQLRKIRTLLTDDPEPAAGPLLPTPLSLAGDDDVRLTA